MLVGGQPEHGLEPGVLEAEIDEPERERGESEGQGQVPHGLAGDAGKVGHFSAPRRSNDAHSERITQAATAATTTVLPRAQSPRFALSARPGPVPGVQRRGVGREQAGRPESEHLKLVSRQGRRYARAHHQQQRPGHADRQVPQPRDDLGDVGRDGRRGQQRLAHERHERGREAVAPDRQRRRRRE